MNRLDSQASAGRWCLGFAILVVAMLAGCAAPLPRIDHHPSSTLVGPSDAPLVRAAHDAGIASGESGVWPMLQGSYALDTRFAMIENARRSIDLSYYLIANDDTGRGILRALRDAARRGVRVRVLVDDLYTAETHRMLEGLDAEPNCEVRLFNPVVTARESEGRRLLAMGLDFKRLNHRMHNKLFIADGVMAIVGGRNLADEYFLRGMQTNFIDLDVLLIGSVVGELNNWFDVYWNSQAVFPLRDIAPITQDQLDPEYARAVLDEETRDDRRPDVPMAPDFFGAPAFSTGLAQHNLQFLSAEISAFADSPNKVDPAHNSIAIDDTLTHRFLLQLSDTRSEAILFSPYFVPGREALDRLRKLREGGVRVRVITNSLAVSDEPLVSVGTERHQVELLKMGVELYELSSERLKLDHTFKDLFGSTTGRLHAKLAFFDHRKVLVGSMNLDPRSSTINTEIGVSIDSPKLSEMLLTVMKVDVFSGVYQVHLQPDGRGVYWTADDEGGTKALQTDPDTGFIYRLRVMLLSFFVPESQL